MAPKRNRKQAPELNCPEQLRDCPAGTKRHLSAWLQPVCWAWGFWKPGASHVLFSAPLCTQRALCTVNLRGPHVAPEARAQLQGLSPGRPSSRWLGCRCVFCSWWPMGSVSWRLHLSMLLWADQTGFPAGSGEKARLGAAVWAAGWRN